MVHDFLNGAVDNEKGDGIHAWGKLVQQSIVFSAVRHLCGPLRSRGASQVSIAVRTWRGFLAGQWAQASGKAQALHKGNSK